MDGRSAGPSPPRPPAGAWAWALSLFAALLCTLPLAEDRLAAGDSPQLLAALRALGIAHPPGYPLWLSAALPLQLLPLGSVPLRAALLSVLCHAGVLVLVAAGVSLQRSDLLRPSPLLTALLGLLALTLPSWRASTGAVEVYPLNTLLVAALTLCGVALLAGRGHRWLLLMCFLHGLSLGGHHTTLLLAPWTAFLLLRELWRARKPGPALALLAQSALAAAWGALAIHSYLLLRMMARPAVNWGSLDSLTDLLRHVRRAEYGALPGGPRSLTEVLAQLRAGLELGLGGLPELLGAVLLLTATLLLWLRPWPTLAVLVPAAGVLSGYVAVLNFTLSPNELALLAPFFLPLLLPVLFLAGHALLPSAKLPLKLALLALWLGLCYTGQRHAPPPPPMLARDYATEMLAAAPPAAHIIGMDDLDLFPLVYLQSVEGWRPDLRLVDGSGHWFPGTFRAQRTFTLHTTWSGSWNQRLQELRESSAAPVYTAFRADPGQTRQGALFGWALTPRPPLPLGEGGYPVSDEVPLLRLDADLVYAPRGALPAMETTRHTYTERSLLLRVRSRLHDGTALRERWPEALGPAEAFADLPEYWAELGYWRLQRQEFGSAEELLRRSLDCFPRQEGVLRLMLGLPLDPARQDEYRAALRQLEAATYRGEPQP